MYLTTIKASTWEQPNYDYDDGDDTPRPPHPFVAGTKVTLFLPPRSRRLLIAISTGEIRSWSSLTHRKFRGIIYPATDPDIVIRSAVHRKRDDQSSFQLKFHSHNHFCRTQQRCFIFFCCFFWINALLAINDQQSSIIYFNQLIPALHRPKLHKRRKKLEPSQEQQIAAGKAKDENTEIAVKP